MRRTVLAFLIAPLWVPAGAWPYAAYMFPYPEQQHWILMTTIVATVFAYGGTAALGIPAFLLLRARKYTSFWIAPVLGFAGWRRNSVADSAAMRGDPAWRPATASRR
jgi:hypothetical protein